MIAYPPFRDIKEGVRLLRTPCRGTLENEATSCRHLDMVLGKAGLSARHDTAMAYWISHSLDGHPDCDIDHPLAASTLYSYVAHVDAAYIRSGLPSPVTSAVLLYLAECIARYGKPALEKRIMRPDELLQIVRSLDLAVLMDVQFRAMLLFGFESAQRPSEWRTINAEDLAYDPDHGFIATFYYAKNNQSGKPRHVTIAFARNEELCPVVALRAWLDRSSITTGPVFRSLSPSIAKCSRSTPMSGKRARILFHYYLTRAGIDPAGLTPRSLRTGRMTLAAEQGQSTSLIVRRSLHRTNEAAELYIKGFAMSMDDYDRALSPSPNENISSNGDSRP